MYNKWINKTMKPGECANLIYKFFNGEDRIMIFVNEDKHIFMENVGIDTACEVRKTLLDTEIFNDQDQKYYFTVGKVYVG